VGGSGGLGVLAGSALLIGAAAGYYLPVPRRVTASVMAFGSGVLLSAISFELLDQAYTLNCIDHVVAGLFTGGMLFAIANVLLTRSGAKHRKRSHAAALARDRFEGSGLAIAVGSVIDTIPESIAIGLTLLAG
jgi:ZIP family zinc transporter